MQLLTLGLNHLTAPVEIRERLAFPEMDQPKALYQLTEEYGLHEAAILSTCNRSELYIAAEEGHGIEQAQQFLVDTRNIDINKLGHHFYTLEDHDAATHLFRVACGIESLVLGESQILNQVRSTLETAQRNGSTRLLLNELFQRSLRTGKRARNETNIGKGHLSISTAAVELAGQVFDNLSDCQAALIGAGEMAELTAKYLAEANIASLVIANRTIARANELARLYKGQGIALSQLSTNLTKMDIIIASTASNNFIITFDMIKSSMELRRGRPILLIDISVPRNIDPKIRNIDNVFLFDIDDLKQVVESHKKNREQEIERVQVIIEGELRDFLSWYNALGTGTLIKDLHNKSDRLREVELARWTSKLNQLEPHEKDLIERILKAYANKLLHDPLVQIRKFANEEDGLIRLDTVRKLFNVENPTPPRDT